MWSGDSGRPQYTDPMPKKEDAGVGLTANAKDTLDQLADGLGMTQVAVLSRLVDWFAFQDVNMQYFIVGYFPKEIEREVANLLLSDRRKR